MSDDQDGHLIIFASCALFVPQVQNGDLFHLIENIFSFRISKAKNRTLINQFYVPLSVCLSVRLSRAFISGSVKSIKSKLISNTKVSWKCKKHKLLSQRNQKIGPFMWHILMVAEMSIMFVNLGHSLFIKSIIEKYLCGSDIVDRLVSRMRERLPVFMTHVKRADRILFAPVPTFKFKYYI